MSEILVRRFTCRFQTMGMGSEAKRMSVKMLMLLLKSPMAVKRWLSKQWALGSLTGSQVARIGVHENAIVLRWSVRAAL